ncbi:MAG: putative N-acetylmannosamine-6-phosphate 2-epimerase [Phyllobacterium sp.]
MNIEQLKHALIVSCQPVPDGPMDHAEMVAAFALAAIEGGADAVRIESVDYVRAVRQATDMPIIGIVKRDLQTSPVRITPYVSDAVALAEAGADIIAFDATSRPRPDPIADIVAAIHASGALAMADCSTVEDGRAALAAGADCVGSTLSGYIEGPVPAAPDFDLIAGLRALTPKVIAEGRIKTPQQAIEALHRGAFSVVVGSAITRTEHVTSWFMQAIGAEIALMDKPEGETVLALDIGGTKTMACLVKAGTVLQELQFPTDRELGPDRWLEAVEIKAAGWHGSYTRVAAAVTGIVVDGTWSALNPATLNLPGPYALVSRLQETFGVDATALNDAQCAAWGEYLFGAGARDDMVFLTVSTGIGGGIVVNGRLLQGTAGHFGLLQGDEARPLEDSISGHWMTAQARAAGHDMAGPEIFAAARSGAAWASQIIALSASRLAVLCQNIQLALDPKRIVLGGGIGLADGYIEQVRGGLIFPTPSLRPTLVNARLGRHAGVIGAAELAIAQSNATIGG